MLNCPTYGVPEASCLANLGVKPWSVPILQIDLDLFDAQRHSDAGISLEQAYAYFAHATCHLLQRPDKPAVFRYIRRVLRIFGGGIADPRQAQGFTIQRHCHLVLHRQMRHLNLQLNPLQLSSICHCVIADDYVKGRSVAAQRAQQIHGHLAVDAVIPLRIHSPARLGPDAAVQGGVDLVQTAQGLLRAHGRQQGAMGVAVAVPVEDVHPVGAPV